MKKVLATLIFLTATVAFAQKGTAPDASYKIKDQDQNGVPTFVAGDIGSLGAGTPDKAAKDFLKAQKHLLHQTGNEDFDATQITKDALGQTHVHHDQIIGVRAQGGKPCRNRGRRGHRKVGVLSLLEEAVQSGTHRMGQA